MVPPSLPEVGREGGPIGAGKWKPGRQSPDEMAGESAGIEDLSHRPGRPTAPEVGHGDRRLAQSAAAAPGAVAPGLTRPVPESSRVFASLAVKAYLWWKNTASWRQLAQVLVLFLARLFGTRRSHCLP